MDKSILEGGLSIISRCKAETGDRWNAHYGAGGIASYFLVRDHGLSGELASRIGQQARAMLDARQPNNEGNADANRKAINGQEAEQQIIAALDGSIEGLHWVGHNAIYAAVSLLAIRELGGWGTQEQIEGICDLIRSFERTIPGRSWIGYSASQVKALALDEHGDWPEIRTPEQLSELVLAELAAFGTIYRAEAHHDLIGHLLTYSHALALLFELGCPAYFERGVPAVLKLAKVLRASRDLPSGADVPLFSPVDRLPLRKAGRSERLPMEPDYWAVDYAEADWDFGHVFKFPFSFYSHMSRVASLNPLAVENFRYIIAGGR
ncbi:hypothetical protein [Paenibacillus sp. MMS18-CY102]|uniref:hypothetical protein n=1 Tax=Paenibacillus sp. MMS18-CY102 TaxID=2682849 RepID=UPI00136556D6|nr:hypothetical protein [Paenibacillus sp. MMS18-CY102]MWC29367.1 hypothetical protein [Paenibacillus sp. MMS18-CY102]